MQRQFVVTGNANDSTARTKAFVADFQALVEKHGLSFSEMAKALTSVGAEVEAESQEEPATNADNGGLSFDLPGGEPRSRTTTNAAADPDKLSTELPE